MSFASLFLAAFLTFSPHLRLPASVQPIQDISGSIFCTAFSVNERQRLYLTAAHCVDEKNIDLPIPTMFSQRIRVVKINKFIDIALIQAALGTRQLDFADQPPGPGAPVIAVGFANGEDMLSLFKGVFRSNAVGMDNNHEMHVVSLFNVRGEHGMSGGPILDENGLVVSLLQLKFPMQQTGGCLLQFLIEFMTSVR